MQVTMGVMLGSMALGYAAPNMQTLAIARGAASSVYKIIDLVSVLVDLRLDTPHITLHYRVLQYFMLCTQSVNRSEAYGISKSINANVYKDLSTT
jgi:hypothetical protein